ncbi:MAG: transporter substrate-binding domain-containing protein, partial [Candidatus Rifleibacteriota bacterium]
MRLGLKILLICTLLLSNGILLAEKEIKVVGFSNYPLYFTDENNNTKGFYVDLIEKIGKEEGWKTSYELTTIAECFSKVKNKQAQLGALFSFSKERAKDVKFSHQNILTLWGKTFVPVSSQIESFIHLKNKKIGFINKGINYVNFSAMARNLSIDFEAVFYESYEKLAQALENEEIEAGIFNNLTGDYIKENYDIKATSIVFEPFSLFFITAHDSPNSDRTIKVLENKIGKWKRQRGSFYYKTLKKWYSAMSQQEPIKMGQIYAIIAILTLIAIVLFLMLRYTR